MEKSTRSVYYRHTFRRAGMFRNLFLHIATFLTSYPRLLIEVFMRRNFGTRYFNVLSFLTVTVLLYIMPFHMLDQDPFGSNAWPIIQMNWAWYGFTLGFIIFGTMRWMEIRQAPSTFNFSKYSLYMGDISPLREMLGVNIRTYEIIVEPAIFFVAGLLFTYLGQNLGGLLIVVSILYSISYVAAYMIGDDSILDLIDEILFSQNIKGILMDGDGPDKANGVQLRGNIPPTTAMKQNLLNRMTEDDDGALAV